MARRAVSTFDRRRGAAPQRAASVLAVLVAMAGQAGCRHLDPIPEPWNTTTVFEFGGLTSSDGVIVERIFDSNRLVYKRISGNPITYEVTGIATTQELGSVKADIDQAMLDRRIDLPLESARLTYGGLQAGGTVSTTIKITASPGARALIADGAQSSPWRRVTLDRAGSWTGPVNRGGVVSGTEGWVYCAVERAGLYRYFKIHLLTGERRDLSQSDLPRKIPPVQAEREPSRPARQP
jgi:hypothetical protein